MKLAISADPRAFDRLASPFLGAHEAEHNLLLGIVAQAARADACAPIPYLACAHLGGRVRAVAACSPGRPAVLSRGWDARAINDLVRDMHGRLGDLDGVLGPEQAARTFAVAWQALSGTRADVALRERIYALESVAPVFRPAGAITPAAESDRSLLHNWMQAFNLETAGSADAARSQQLVRTRAPGGPDAALYLWRVEARPVAMAGFSGPTPNGIRVAPVYTPPEERRHGYATALVADLTRLLLASGRRWCFLFTDLDNLTTNHIYQEIGYRPVADMTQWRFRTPRLPRR